RRNLRTDGPCWADGPRSSRPPPVRLCGSVATSYKILGIHMAHPTKKDLAYDFIRRRILEKRLLPGQRITASQIAEEIGTSVLPVREALLSLEAERLVTITPYVGAVVAWVSADEVYEVISMLAVLEGYATAQALPHSTALGRSLPAINARLRAALQQEMWSWFIELNREFHFTIFEAADNSVLVENIRIFWSQLDTMLASDRKSTRLNSS